MRNFNGGWTIRPYGDDALDELVRYPKRQWGPFHSFKKALHQFEDTLVGGKHGRTSLVVLHQSVAPSMIPPPPLEKILKKITTAQVRQIMEDLLREADRRNSAYQQKQAKKSAEREGEDGRDLTHYIRSFIPR